jgi:hypothetical protein
MALLAIVDKPGAYKVILERYPEGVYVLLYDRPGTEQTARDDLQDDWEMAKRFALRRYGITEDLWKEIPNIGFHGLDRCC